MSAIGFAKWWRPFSPLYSAYMVFQPKDLAEDRATAMIPDESAPPHPETEAPRPLAMAANDNGGAAASPIDPRILIIARAIGRLIVLEQLGRMRPDNDNEPEEGCWLSVTIFLLKARYCPFREVL
jgi:hypothetical protein